MKKFVLTISRQFGSGGRLIGKMLSEKLGVPFYDKELIELTAQKSGLSPEFIAQSDERAPSAFSFGLSGSAAAAGYITQYDTPMSDRTYFAQSALITELADRESCIIVGRNASYILRNHPDRVSLLFHAPLDDRIARAVESYGMSTTGLAEQILKIDKARANYIKRYSGENWMDARAYDMCIDTSKLGLDAAVAAVNKYLECR